MAAEKEAKLLIANLIQVALPLDSVEKSYGRNVHNFGSRVSKITPQNAAIGASGSI
jgi:hypothetical protein